MIPLNLLGPYPFDDTILNGLELLFFAFIAIILVSGLLFYHSKIPKSNFKENEIKIERRISLWPKIVVYLLIIIPIIKLLVEFFNFGNLFTSFDIGMLSSLVTLILYLNITSEIRGFVKKPKLKNPIYQSKDILLQSNSTALNYFGVKETTSTWVKTLVYVSILLLVLFPLNIV
jgi:hypothetical protein